MEFRFHFAQHFQRNRLSRLGVRVRVRACRHPPLSQLFGQLQRTPHLDPSGKVGRGSQPLAALGLDRNRTARKKQHVETQCDGRRANMTGRSPGNWESPFRQALLYCLKDQPDKLVSNLGTSTKHAILSHLVLFPALMAVSAADGAQS